MEIIISSDTFEHVSKDTRFSANIYLVKVNSVFLSHLFLFLLFFTLNKEMLAGLAEVTIAECSENKPIEIN